MPKIGKHGFDIAGETITLDIVYHKSDKKFAIKMPEKMAMVVTQWRPDERHSHFGRDVTGATEDEVIAEFEKQVKDYEIAIKKTDKVILYAVAGSSHAEGSERNDLERISRELGGWGHRSDWVGLLIRHKVAYRATVDSQVTYRDEDGSEVAYSWRPDKKDGLIRAIPWTQEREDFFASLQTQLERMIERAMAHLDREPEAMIDFIDTHKAGLLLTGPKG